VLRIKFTIHLITRMNNGAQQFDQTKDPLEPTKPKMNSVMASKKLRQRAPTLELPLAVNRAPYTCINRKQRSIKRIETHLSHQFVYFQYIPFIIETFTLVGETFAPIGEVFRSIPICVYSNGHNLFHNTPP
jgi:hypothetical protein